MVFVRRVVILAAGRTAALAGGTGAQTPPATTPTATARRQGGSTRSSPSRLSRPRACWKLRAQARRAPPLFCLPVAAITSRRVLGAGSRVGQSGSIGKGRRDAD